VEPKPADIDPSASSLTTELTTGLAIDLTWGSIWCATFDPGRLKPGAVRVWGTA